MIVLTRRWRRGQVGGGGGGGGGVVGQVVGQVGEVLQPARCQLEGQVEHLTYSWRGQGLHV